MSDPNRTGPYDCCGPMIAVELPDIYDGACAFLCERCFVWRHRFSPGDARRAKVDAAMPVMIEALLMGARGEVE